MAEDQNKAEDRDQTQADASVDTPVGSGQDRTADGAASQSDSTDRVKEQPSDEERKAADSDWEADPEEDDDDEESAE